MFTFANLILNVSIRSKIIGLILLIYVSLFAVSFYFFADFVNRVERDLGEKLVNQQVSVTKERALNYFANNLSLIETGLINNTYQGWMKNPASIEFKTLAIEAISATCTITDCKGWFMYSHNTLEGFDWLNGNMQPKESKIVLDRDKWYTYIIGTGKTYYTDASIHPFTQEPYVYFDYFVRENGQLLGLVGTFVDIAPTIADVLNHPSEQVSNLLIDNNGLVRGFKDNNSSSEHDELISSVNNKRWQTLFEPSISSILPSLKSDSSQTNTMITQRITLDNKEYLAAFMFIEELEWYSVSLLDAEILSGKIDTLPMVVISILVLIIVILITIYVLNTQLFKPILSIHHVIKKISQGRHNEKVRLINNDELGALAQGINQMTEELSSNVSKIKEQNVALSIAMESATKATKAKSLFLSNMSHELRTPMNAVLGFTQIGIEAKGEHSKDDYLKKVNQAGEHLLLIINDILDFNKIEAHELSLENAPFVLSEVVRSVLHICHLRATNKGLDLKFNIDENIPKQLVGDALRVKQILINLVSNAIKFTESGQIEIECRLSHETYDNVTVAVSVKDSGIGMSSEQISRLFKPFTQADESITRKYGGTGLGLAITKQLIELMRGQIKVISEENKGSDFSFTLVLGREQGNPIPIANEHKDVELEIIRQQTKGLRALLVEDIQINQIVAEKLLEPLLLNVDLAEDGLVAVEKATNNQYDIIFMDVHMPNLDGIGATQQIREFNNEVVIIGLSADANKADVDVALNSGMNDYVTKPIKQDELFNTIHKILNGI